jgi:GGDEF domain-containing protein
MSGTEAYDRDYMRERVRDELARARRHKRSFAVVVFELLPSADGLLPHRKMEAGLQILNASIREEDCAGKAFDDTIVVLLVETDVPGAKDTLMRLRNRLTRIAGSWRVTAYTFPKDEEQIARMPLLTAA